MSLDTKTDEELVKLAQDSSNGLKEEVVNRICKKYWIPIYRFNYGFVGNKEIAEDLTQETFIKVYTQLHRFKNKGYKFRTWLWEIAKKNFFTYLKTNKRRDNLTFSYDNKFIFNNFDEDSIYDLIEQKENLPPDEQYREEDLHDFINERIDALAPPRSRELFKAYCYGEASNDVFSYQELAKIFEIPEGTVKSQINRARRKVSGDGVRKELYSQ